MNTISSQPKAQQQQSPGLASQLAGSTQGAAWKVCTGAAIGGIFGGPPGAVTGGALGAATHLIGQLEMVSPMPKLV